jgi:hypothetical protein
MFNVRVAMILTFALGFFSAAPAFADDVAVYRVCFDSGWVCQRQTFEDFYDCVNEANAKGGWCMAETK